MNRLIYYAVSFLVFAWGCTKNEIVNPTGKPDLTIDTISYQRLPNCWTGPYGGVYCAGPRFEFILRIRNIGDADLNQYFYISNSRSLSDFESKYCSHTTIVNDPTTKVSINGYVDVKFVDFIDDSVPKVLFVINTNDLFDRGVPLPTIEEKRYDNNSYILDLQW